MLTYTLKKAPGVPLYEALYRAIRQDITEGRLPAGTKLPSQRALAANLKVSKITVEAAYDHLSQEGYIRSYPKRGFFVEQTELCRPRPRQPEGMPAEAPEAPPFDLTGSAPGDFPFTVWSRLERQVMLDVGTALLKPLPNQGAPELRRAIADHLFQFRGFRADPENILVGAGTDFLYTLLVQILGWTRPISWRNRATGKSAAFTPPPGPSAWACRWTISGSVRKASWGPTCCTFPPPIISPRASSPPCPGGLNCYNGRKPGDIISLRTITTANSASAPIPCPRWRLWTTGAGSST